MRALFARLTCLETCVPGFCDENPNETLSYAFRFIENSARGSGPSLTCVVSSDNVDVSPLKL